MTPKSRQYLLDPGTYTTVLVAIMLDEYGTEFLEWEPEIFEIELPNTLPTMNFDKLNAATTLLTTDTFYTDPLAFNMVGEALNSDPVDYRVLDPLDPEQLAWAVVESQLLEDPEDKPSFSEDVRRYMGVLLAEKAMFSPPAILQDIVDYPADRIINQTAMSDEQEVFALFQKKQQADKDLVNDYVVSNVQELINQLDDVELANRNQETWQAFMERAGQVSKNLSR